METVGFVLLAMNWYHTSRRPLPHDVVTAVTVALDDNEPAVKLHDGAETNVGAGAQGSSAWANVLFEIKKTESTKQKKSKLDLVGAAFIAITDFDG